METAFLDYLTAFGDSFANPQKRIFVGYLLAALAIAVAAILLSSRHARRGGMRLAFRRLFDRRIWWSASAKGDYRLFIANQAVMLAVAPALLSQLTLAGLLFEGLHDAFGTRISLWPALPAWVVMAAFTTCHFVLDDFSKYGLHRLLHRWPVLWAFHKVHHSAETMTPMTVYRTHPVEGVLFALRSTVVQAVGISTFVFFFGDRVDLLTVLGANVFLFAFNVTGANLRHSHVPISYGRFLEHILISPDSSFRRSPPSRPEFRHGAGGLGLGRRQSLPVPQGRADTLRARRGFARRGAWLKKPLLPARRRCNPNHP